MLLGAVAIVSLTGYFTPKATARRLSNLLEIPKQLRETNLYRFKADEKKIKKKKKKYKKKARRVLSNRYERTSQVYLSIPRKQETAISARERAQEAASMRCEA